MQENKEISALFHLIDDPDEDVFCTVSEKIVSLISGSDTRTNITLALGFFRQCLITKCDASNDLDN